MGAFAMDLFSRVVEGYVAPRRSIRRLLDEGVDEAARLLLVLFAYCLNAVELTVALSRITDPEVLAQLDASPPLMRHVAMLGATFLTYLMLSFFMRTIGNAFKGTADADACRTTVGWWMFITSFFSLIEAFAVAVFGLGVGSVLEPIRWVIVLTLFSMMAAETHRFESSARVGAVVGAIFLMLALFVIRFMQTG